MRRESFAEADLRIAFFSVPGAGNVVESTVTAG